MLGKTIIWVFRAIIAGIISCFILSLFVCVYHYEGIHINNVGMGTDYRWEPQQIKSQMTEGFAWFRMDENGFNNQSVPEQVDILLMGSSHMEACEVAQEKNLGSILNVELPQYQTYNIGIGGHTIYRCVDNIEEALVEYAPSKYIIMETDRVKMDLKSMRDVIEEKASAIPSYDSGVIYYLQKIPAVKLLYSQISNWIEAGGEDIEQERKQVDWSAYKKVLTAFLLKANRVASKEDRKLIIFYQPQTKLMSDGSLDCGKGDEEYLQIFSEICRDIGIVFVDLTSSFQELYSDRNILAHGFANSAVGEGHLNEYGHKVIATTLVEKIQEMDGG